MSLAATPSRAVSTEAGSVVALWRYPVKSMMGEELNSSEITPRSVGVYASVVMGGTIRRRDPVVLGQPSGAVAM